MFGLADRDQAGIEVDVLACERDRFTDPHARDGKKAEQRLIARRPQRTRQPPRFLQQAADVGQAAIENAALVSRDDALLPYEVTLIW